MGMYPEIKNVSAGFNGQNNYSHFCQLLLASDSKLVDLLRTERHIFKSFQIRSLWKYEMSLRLSHENNLSMKV